MKKTIKTESIRTLSIILLLTTLSVSGCTAQPDKEQKICTPTPYDEIGPFYRQGAPIRNSVGKGYIMSGQVLSVEGCKPLPQSKIEFWLVNSQGEYDDAHRATVFADKKGNYRFESNQPTEYVGRLPHIHMKITANGHQELITQHYPKEGGNMAVFDLVLEKER